MPNALAKNCLGMLLIGGAIFSMASCTAPEQPGAWINEIVVYASPGKPAMVYDPTKPAEQITARRNGTQSVLIVGVNVPRENISAYHEEQGNLAPAEWDALLATVTQQNLLDYAPQRAKTVAIDYGTYGFTIRGVRQNSQQWDTPPENAQAPMVLTKQMAQLARNKIKSFELDYLVP